MIILDPINISLIIVGILNAAYGLIVLRSNTKSLSNRTFFAVVLAVIGWTIGMVGVRAFATEEYVKISAHLLYLSPATIPYLFIYFAYAFPDKKHFFSKKLILLNTLPYLYILFITLAPNVFIKEVIILPNEENRIVFNQIHHFFYIAYVMGSFSWAYAVLIRKYIKATDGLKVQLRFILLGTMLSTGIAVSTNLVPPFFDFFQLNWVGQISVVAMITAIFYAILKHHLFSVKVIATEIITFFLWIFILIRTFIAVSPSDRIANAVLLVITIVVGILLIRSVIKEVESRERVEQLADQLAHANSQLRELNRQKTEFLSIASHQFRTPLTAIKGYSSMVLEGSFGELSDKVRGAVDRVYQSSEHLVTVIDDFLDVSRIELGRMKYNFVVTDFRKIVKDVLAAEKPAIEKSSLKFNILLDEQGDFTTTIDIEKIKQVLFNIIENSIKYTPHGSITIMLSRVADRIHFTVKDTGVGVSKEDQQKLFKKFSRVQAEKRTNITGTGLGLFVAKEILEHHSGEVWMESEGEGKGSIFHIELKAGRNQELLGKKEEAQPIVT